MTDARLEEVESLFDQFRLFQAYVAFHPAQNVRRIIDAVAGHLLEQVHDRLTVAPRVHEQGIETGFVSGNAQPQQMAVKTFQPGHDLADRLGSHRHFHLGQFLHALGIGHRMDMGADAAYPFEQVQVLDPVAAFGGLLDAAVGVPETHARRGDDLAIDGELEMSRLLQGGMLRADRNDKRIAIDHAFFRRRADAAVFDRPGLFHVEICPHGIDTLGPVIGDEQPVAAPGPCEVESEHFVHLSLEEGCRRDDVFDRRQAGTVAARLADAQGGDRRSVTEVIERLHLAGLDSQVQAGDRREIAPFRIVQGGHGRAQVIDRHDDIQPVRLGVGCFLVPVCKKLFCLL